MAYDFRGRLLAGELLMGTMLTLSAPEIAGMRGQAAQDLLADLRG